MHNIQQFFEFRKKSVLLFIRIKFMQTDSLDGRFGSLFITLLSLLYVEGRGREGRSYPVLQNPPKPTIM